MTNSNTRTSLETLRNREDVEKLLELEKKIAHKSGFWRGVLVGFAGIWALIFFILIFLVINKETLINQSADFVVSHVMEGIFQAFPDGYWTKNHDKIVPILDRFTNAAADHKISKAEYGRISRRILYALKDRRLTYQELENILDLLNEASISSEKSSK